MKNCFVVTSGCYSSYHIVAVFATLVEAQAFTNHAEDIAGSDVGIGEWALGAPEGEEGFRPGWKVALDLSTGDVLRREQTVRQEPQNWSEAAVFGDTVYGESVIGEDHALKVAAECRQAYLREHGPVKPRQRGGGCFTSIPERFPISV